MRMCVDRGKRAEVAPRLAPVAAQARLVAWC